MARINKTRGNYTSQSPFPIDTTTFDDLQSDIFLIERLAKTAGEKCVIDGLETDGAEGTAVIGGEVLHAEAGQGTYLTVRTEQVNVSYNGGQTNNAYTRKRLEWTPVAPAGQTSYRLSDLTRTGTLKDLQAEQQSQRQKIEEIQPEAVGTIKMWPSATKGPGGVLFTSENSRWRLCDGTAIADEWTELKSIIGGSALPDMRGMFVAGYRQGSADYGEIGQTGGEERHTLTQDEMPSHSHSIKGREIRKSGTSTPLVVLDSIDSGYNEERILDNRILNTGGGQPHENRPPYIVMAYIIKVK